MVKKMKKRQRTEDKILSLRGSESGETISFSKGLSVVEYSMLVVIVVTALIGIQIFLKRAVSGNWKQAGDVFGYGRQYEPPPKLTPL